MIGVKLMGGLGNQMFQYAAGKRLALSNQTKLILDTSHYTSQPEEEVPRHYELSCFNIDASLVNEPIEYTGFKKRFRTVIPEVIREKSFSFDKKILKAPDNSLLIGYWQSEKYFQDTSNKIKQDFRFKDALSDSKEKVAREIINTESSISLQVRRGDFVTHPQSSRFHGALPLDYYDRAIAVITRSIKSPVFFVISDDPAWCRKNLKIGYQTYFVDHIPDTGHEDMRLISMCRHNIIANSTFSWWGAWLNQNPRKIVIAPKQWFKNPRTKTPDVVPRGWIRV